MRLIIPHERYQTMPDEWYLPCQMNGTCRAGWMVPFEKTSMWKCSEIHPFEERQFCPTLPKRGKIEFNEMTFIRNQIQNSHPQTWKPFPSGKPFQNTIHPQWHTPSYNGPIFLDRFGKFFWRNATKDLLQQHRISIHPEYLWEKLFSTVRLFLFLCSVNAGKISQHNANTAWWKHLLWFEILPFLNSTLSSTKHW